MKRKDSPRGIWWEQSKGCWYLVSHDVCWGVVYRAYKGQEVWGYVNHTLCGPVETSGTFTIRTEAMAALRREVGK